MDFGGLKSVELFLSDFEAFFAIEKRLD